MRSAALVPTVFSMRSYFLILAVFLLAQCKTNQVYYQPKEKTEGEGYIVFHSKTPKGTILVDEHGLSCLKDTLLQSFRDNLPHMGISRQTKRLYIDLTPWVKDSTSCNGLYIYRTFTGTINAYYRDGTPYYFFAINGNQALFFGHDDVEGNRKKLESFKGMPIYPEMLEYEDQILNNLILIK